MNDIHGTDNEFIFISISWSIMILHTNRLINVSRQYLTEEKVIPHSIMIFEKNIVYIFNSWKCVNWAFVAYLEENTGVIFAPKIVEKGYYQLLEKIQLILYLV